jgi:acetate kinase
MAHRILALNTGSSSIKASMFEVTAEAEGRLGTASQERVGADMAGATRAAIAQLLRDGSRPAAVSHRIVHGGPSHVAPEWLTDAVLADLTSISDLAPEHVPGSLAAIEVARRMFPDLPQAVCFDTAFHRSMPPVAATYALPARCRDAGLRRYGFHGLSCEFIMRALGGIDPAAAQGRVIIAHLGSGASLTAVDDGRSRDTTMGLTPTGGVVMSTRAGDLDPGVVLYTLQHLTPDVPAGRHLFSHESGLLGVSGTSADVRDLLAAEPHDDRARLALDLFCYSVRKATAALAAALEGLDTFVFTGGIGEHSAVLRHRIVQPLGWMGLRLDHARNDAHAGVLSPDDAPVTVRRIATDEDAMLARHAYDLMERSGLDGKVAHV